jgi:hypothetical protein
MKLDNLTQSVFHDPISRREFLAASMASVLAATFDRHAMADRTASEGKGISDAAFERATQRAALLVNRMSLEEVTEQVVHSAPALPKLALA